ncbi:MAG: helix-turn-helix domain-containing protein [Hyphomicrobiaceae bacterium]
MSNYDDGGDCRSAQQDPITIDQHIGLCLLAHREANRLSVPATAAKIGVSADTLVAIEAGMARPTAGCLIMLSTLLEIKITDLFRGYVSMSEQIAKSNSSHRTICSDDNVVMLPDQTH